jgi:hypothetical protein
MALTECLQVSFDMDWTYARKCRYAVKRAEVCAETAIWF